MVYPDAVWTGDSPNQNPRRASVRQVILHHTASTGNVLGIRDMFMQPNNSRQVSANFLVAQNGDVYEIVNPDTGRAWTTGSGPGGSMSPDHYSITLECMDSTGDPTWLQSAESLESIAQLIAWSAKRYGFTPKRGVTVFGHREMPGQSTACPGGMDMDWATNRALEILAGDKTPGKITQEELDELASTLSASIIRNYESGEISLVYPSGHWQKLGPTQDIAGVCSAFAAVYGLAVRNPIYTEAEAHNRYGIQLDGRRYTAFKNAYEG